jgi:GT2 family glycosyltransferase
MDLSILIVNWNSARYLDTCLLSVYREVKDIAFEVLVVDNASYDGSAELVKKKFPQVTFIQSDKNLGFVRANNLLFRHAQGRNILLLNPDTEVVGDAILKMLGYLESLPKAGAIGCRLLNADGSTQTSSIQAFPTLLNQLLDAEVLRRRFPGSPLWKLRPLFEDAGTPVQVDAISGACLMIKRAVFEAVGFMSDDYLMYSDDVDLSYKVHAAGYWVYHASECRVIHYGGRSTASLEQGLTDVWMRNATYQFFVKFYGRWYATLYKTVMACAALVRLLLIASMRAVAASASRRERLSRSSAKWTRTLQWALGMKGWAERGGERIGLAAK